MGLSWEQIRALGLSWEDIRALGLSWSNWEEIDYDDAIEMCKTRRNWLEKKIISQDVKSSEIAAITILLNDQIEGLIDLNSKLRDEMSRANEKLDMAEASAVQSDRRSIAIGIAGIIVSIATFFLGLYVG